MRREEISILKEYKFQQWLKYWNGGFGYSNSHGFRLQDEYMCTINAVSSYPHPGTYLLAHQ